MNPNNRPLAYILLGAPASGRRQILADLIGGGLDERDRAVTFLSADEAESEFDARLGEVRRWRWEDSAIAADKLEDLTAVGEGPTSARRPPHLFFVAEGSRNPVDQIEVLKPWLAVLGFDLGRVITVVDCQRAHEHPALLSWYDACVHFSDVVLLARREGIPNKWMSDFKARYRDKFIPALFELIKNGGVKNPALILEPEARRVTHIFDEDSDLTLARSLAPEAAIEFSDEKDELAEDDEDEADADREPYFERRQNGHRVIELPDIRKYPRGGVEG